MGYYVPKTLEKLNNWVLWRLDDGKKKPYAVKYNGLASVAKPYQWASYGAAVDKLQYTDNYNGLGFVFTEASGLVFIDLDHCINEQSGELSDFASNIVGAFSGTYIEYSQSGNGLHIVCKGTIPAAYKSEKIEIYNAGRYMAFTGNAYEAAEPINKQAELNRLCSFFDITKKEPVKLEAQPTTADDEAILKRCEKWADFRQLYYYGEHSLKRSGGELDESRADYRLAFILLSCCNGDRERAARLFMNSKLAEREKCQRTDYIQRTIEAAARNMPAPEQRQQHKRKPANNRPQPKTYTKQEEEINGIKVY